MNVEILIPILISLGAFAMIVGLRYLASKEKMAMIEKGMDPGMKRSRTISPFITLKFGMVILGFGVGICSPISSMLLSCRILNLSTRLRCILVALACLAAWG